MNHAMDMELGRLEVRSIHEEDLEGELESRGEPEMEEKLSLVHLLGENEIIEEEVVDDDSDSAPIFELKEKVEMSTADGQLAEGDPLQHIEFQASTNANFSPDANRKDMCRGVHFTMFARSCLSATQLRDATEASNPHLPSLVYGPKRGTKGCLYVGSLEASRSRQFLVQYGVKLVVILLEEKCSLSADYLISLQSDGTKAHALCLDEETLYNSAREEVDQNWVCFTASGIAGRLAEKWRASLFTLTCDEIEKYLRRGSVLISGEMGQSDAPCMASLYIARKKGISFIEAFKEVSKRRRSTLPIQRTDPQFITADSECKESLILELPCCSTLCMPFL